MDYYGLMKLIHRHARRPSSQLWAATFLAITLAATPAAWGQTSPGERRARVMSETQANAELFYEVLLGELNASGGEPGTGYALMLDAARKANDGTLYKRAADIALQSRSGDAALVAARAWKQALPQDREANRYELQILLAMGRIADTVEPLRQELAHSNLMGKTVALATIPPLYARAPDKKLAADVVESALANELANPDTAAAALTAVGRMRLAAGDISGALDAARRAQAKDPLIEGPAILALEIMGPNAPLAEPIVRKYIDGKPLPAVRLAYARALAGEQRYSDAAQQLKAVTSAQPELAEAWLLQGTLQAQQNQYAEAETSLKSYITLEQAKIQAAQAEGQSRGLVQAWLLLARMAETRKDFAAADKWLAQIENPQGLLDVQVRRASVLAAQGKLDEARALLQQLPTNTPELQRVALMAEVQLLRDNQKYQPALDLLAAASAKDPKDGDLIYEQAMLADKMGNTAEMERLLRALIASHPDYHHAYNALGYSLADRGVQLPEARVLIQKALTFAPNDPFINDSLAWVEFRAGNLPEALRILEIAYKARPDAEIAAHLGEVLWASGQKDRAIATWKEGLQRSADNETLLETLKRLQVKL